MRNRRSNGDGEKSSHADEEAEGSLIERCDERRVSSSDTREECERRKSSKGTNGNGRSNKEGLEGSGLVSEESFPFPDFSEKDLLGERGTQRGREIGELEFVEDQSGNVGGERERTKTGKRRTADMRLVR